MHFFVNFQKHLIILNFQSFENSQSFVPFFIDLLEFFAVFLFCFFQFLSAFY